MSRELVIVWAGRHQRGGWQSLCEDLEKRITRFVAVRDIPVRARGAAGNRLEAEGTALLAAVPRDAWLIALDRRGLELDSVDFSRQLMGRIDEWPGPIAFVIGSDLGLATAVLEAARQRLSLGPMTFPHELARTMLIEQIYRAFAIDRGIKYHRRPV